MKKKNRLNEIKMKVKQDTNKDSKIIDLLKYPAAALIILSILRVLSFIAAPGIESYFVVLICAVYFYIGWTATKKYNFSLWKAAFAGALAVIIAAVFYLGTLAVF
jgi:ABC-type phosphate transport system permease subunit